MAQKMKKLEEILSLKGEVAKVVSYADYFALLSSGLADVSAPVFVLAAENIDFRRIFQ